MCYEWLLGREGVRGCVMMAVPWVSQVSLVS